jgi:protein TonB
MSRTGIAGFAGLILALTAGSTGAVEAPKPPATVSQDCRTDPPRIQRPDWIQRPTQEQFLRAYPRAAFSRGREGHATMVCTVTADGRLKDCTISEETPAGAGFGQAALSLAPSYRMPKTSECGGPVAGARVTIPIHFAV